VIGLASVTNEHQVGCDRWPSLATDVEAEVGTKGNLAEEGDLGESRLLEHGAPLLRGQG
jgi:hypothetical protein